MEVGAMMHIDIRDTLFFATIHPDRCLRIWPDNKFSPSAKQRDLYTLPDEVSFLTQCPDRHLIFVGCANGEVVVWQASLAALFVKFNAAVEQTKKSDKSHPDSHEEDHNSLLGPSEGQAVIAVEFILPLPKGEGSQQGALLVCCSDGYIRTWDLGMGGTEAPPVMLQESYSDHVGVTFSAHTSNKDKTKLITADIEGYIKVWDITADCNDKLIRRGSMNIRPGKVNEIDHWRSSRRPVNSMTVIGSTMNHDTGVQGRCPYDLLVTTSMGMDATFWTLDGIKVGCIGEGVPVLWDTSDKTRWMGYPALQPERYQLHEANKSDPSDAVGGAMDETRDATRMAEMADLARINAMPAGLEKDEEMSILKARIEARRKDDRRKVVKDMVGNIYDQKRLKKNNFKIDRTMNALKVKSPKEIEYRQGTGPQVLITMDPGSRKKNVKKKG